MKSILFICQANAGRSQMAEGYFRFFNKKGKVVSAGVVDKREKYNYHPATHVVEVMKEEGIDISQQEVKVVTKGMVKQADKIVVLCKKEECPVYLKKSKKAKFMYVEDPSTMYGDDLRQVRDRIKEVVKAIVEELND